MRSAAASASRCARCAPSAPASRSSSRTATRASSSSRWRAIRRSAGRATSSACTSTASAARSRPRAGCGSGCRNRGQSPIFSYACGSIPLRSCAAALLLAMCAAGAARSEDTLERGAQAQRSLEERLKEKARTIPGTDTLYLIAGYVQVDGHWTRRELSGEEKDTFLASAIPFGAADSDSRLSVRASQINAILYTPTSWGGFRALAQADLFAYEEGAKPNLTQLAARFGDWLTVGKTYSTFMDEEAWPSTLDYNGPSGAVFVRQALVRGSLPVAEKLRLEVALEDGGGGRADFVARARFEGDRLHAQLAGLSRSDGSGFSASVSLRVGEGRRLLAQWTSGKGIEGYFNDGLSSVGGTLESPKLQGGYFYYEHQWLSRWSTTAGISELRAKGDDAQPADDLKRVQYASANLVHRLTPNLYLGGEPLRGMAERQNGAQASDSRIQLSARYLIF